MDGTSRAYRSTVARRRVAPIGLENKAFDHALVVALVVMVVLAAYELAHAVLELQPFGLDGSIATLTLLLGGWALASEARAWWARRTRP